MFVMMWKVFRGSAGAVGHGEQRAASSRASEVEPGCRHRRIGICAISSGGREMSSHERTHHCTVHSRLSFRARFLARHRLVSSTIASQHHKAHRRHIARRLTPHHSSSAHPRCLPRMKTRRYNTHTTRHSHALTPFPPETPARPFQTLFAGLTDRFISSGHGHCSRNTHA